jgi:signal transduction histidine kinase
MPACSSNLSSPTRWAMALIAAPLFLIVVESFRGAIQETGQASQQTLKDEIQSLQGKAAQYGEGLQTLIEARGASALAWSEVRSQPWFLDYWSKIELNNGGDAYAAVIDDSGTIVMHSDQSRIGKRLNHGWYEKKVSDAGPDVVWANHSSISGDRPTYDASAPLSADGISLGEYHQGLNGQWVEEKVDLARSAILWQWFPVLLLIGGVDSAAIASLVYLARGQRQSSSALATSGEKRAKELSQLGSGLAHEIRNPLHALRINLHTLKRAIGGRQLPEEQLVATIDESNGAIDRLDTLMRDFLQFAEPSAGERENVDVIQTLRTTLILLSENLRRDQIQVHSNLPPGNAIVSMNPLRLKQLLLNVLTFAQNRVEKGGRINIELTVDPKAVEINVGDSGPAIIGEQKSRLFEPFQAPAETGSGLGLALVHAFAEEVGGIATWEGDGANSNLCRVRLPLARSRLKGIAV